MSSNEYLNNLHFIHLREAQKKIHHKYAAATSKMNVSHYKNLIWFKAESSIDYIIIVFYATNNLTYVFLVLIVLSAFICSFLFVFVWKCMNCDVVCNV